MTAWGMVAFARRVPAAIRLGVAAMLVTLAVVVGSATPAQACSCVSSSPAEMIARSEAGFIGVLVGGPDDIERSPSVGEVGTFVFEIVEPVSGDVPAAGERIEVRSATNGAACGFEITGNGEVAVFLFRNADGLTGGLCSTLRADAVRAHLHAPAFQPEVPARYLVVGTGDAHFYLVGAGGELVGEMRDETRSGGSPADIGLPRITLCPGQRRIVEQWRSTLVVRDVATARIEREASLRDTDGWVIHCADPEAGLVAGIAHTRGLVDVTSGELIYPSAQLRAFDAHGRNAVVSEGFPWADEVVLVDLVDHTTRTLHRVGDHIGVAATDWSVTPSVEQVAFSPDGTRIAFAVVLYPEDEPRTTLVYVYSVDGTLLHSTELSGEGAGVTWVDEGRLLLSGYGDGNGYTATLLDAANLEVLGDLPPLIRWVASAKGDDLVGLNGSTLSSISQLSPDAAITPLRALPIPHAAYPDELWVLDEPLSYQGPVPDRAVSEAPPPTPPPTTTTPTNVAADRGPTDAGGSNPVETTAPPTTPAPVGTETSAPVVELVEPDGGRGGDDAGTSTTSVIAVTGAAAAAAGLLFAGPALARRRRRVPDLETADPAAPSG
jgi:hypothetical protein